MRSNHALFAFVLGATLAGAAARADAPKPLLGFSDERATE